MYDKYNQPVKYDTAELAASKGFKVERGSTKFIEVLPTQSELQTWLRRDHNLHVFIGFRPNVKKWDSHSYDVNLTGEAYAKQRPLQANYTEPIYDSYEAALEAGIVGAIEKIKGGKTSVGIFNINDFVFILKPGMEIGRSKKINVGEVKQIKSFAPISDFRENITFTDGTYGGSHVLFEFGYFRLATDAEITESKGNHTNTHN